MASIEVKETVCKAYANGEINSYEGKKIAIQKEIIQKNLPLWR